MKGSKLDLCLSRGYFRMHQEIFTCNAVLFDYRVCSVHWLRLVLANVRYGAKQLRLLRSNEKFSVAIKPLALSEELETLYAIYKEAINFDAPNSVEACLFDGATYNMFDTYVIEVRDENRLIAAGIFDNGAQSIAGIMNFYHPDYRKYSLGKYLMLLKINHARLQQKAYYYPGYMANDFPKFDYKLFPCEAATEVFDSFRTLWLPFSWETVTALSADIMGEG
ncbi:arginine-tRNA-protein transferase [Spirosoma endophyticum]|uniref:Arginine-tRNA-protein transferase n=1 Tax=Spirosoma endophyticum TaxID=662367 RepID=A0A1I2EI57_9BACT|nr:arginine-tRNA-protein transferase [Spirosoma endophyticum]SFE92774.1 arginine-tRNA-protein transferase [Spirosoma endophyticum]